jgi:DNA-binding transcriptional ArsR family regulator
MGDTVLRIHFSTADLLRIRIAAEPHPMWEVLLSLHVAQTRQGEPVFGMWRCSLPARPVPRSGLLRTLYRPKGYSPDFLTPALPVPDFATGLELVMSTPKRRLRADITQLAAEGALPAWVSGIADGEVEPLRRLRTALTHYHATALAPHWASIRHHVRADRDKRADLAVASGFESVLATLHPTVTWRAPVLAVAYPVDQELRLEGRGLILQPSFFCWHNPVTLLNQFDTPVLVYPVERDPDWALGCCEDPDTSTRSLTALLGHTRTAVLRAIADRNRLNTTDLARTIGISLAGASQHATVLRNAGLVTTVRHRGSALHQVSARGTALLNQCPVSTSSARNPRGGQPSSLSSS